MAAYSDNLMTMLEQPWSSAFRTDTTTTTTTFADCYPCSSVYSDEDLHRTIISNSPQSDNVSLPPTSKPPPKRGKEAVVVGPTGRRVTKKRKSRASKRQATTFFETDPANFREMVQQVTGVRGAAEGGFSSAFVGSGFLRGGGVDFDSFCSFPTLESSKLQF